MKLPEWAITTLRLVPVDRVRRVPRTHRFTRRRTFVERTGGHVDGLSKQVSDLATRMGQLEEACVSLAKVGLPLPPPHTAPSQRARSTLPRSRRWLLLPRRLGSCSNSFAPSRTRIAGVRGARAGRGMARKSHPPFIPAAWTTQEEATRGAQASASGGEGGHGIKQVGFNQQVQRGIGATLPADVVELGREEAQRSCECGSSRGTRRCQASRSEPEHTVCVRKRGRGGNPRRRGQGRHGEAKSGGDSC